MQPAIDFEQVVVAISTKPAPSEQDSAREDAIRLATAVLMLDVARADHVFDETEFDEVLKLVETHFGLSPEDSAELVNEADYKAENLTSLHEFTQLLHDNLDNDEKALRKMLKDTFRKYAERQKGDREFPRP